MKGLYLCSRKHRIAGYDIDYNDIIGYPGINVLKDAYTISEEDLKPYDYIIATPPCNYYSRANYKRETSKVAQLTKELLPHCIDICIKSGKPFIIENVCNSSLLPKTNLFEFDIGNHHYYTNIFMAMPCKKLMVKQNKAHVCRNKRDNNHNVHIVLDTFLRSLI